MKKISGTWD